MSDRDAVSAILDMASDLKEFYEDHEEDMEMVTDKIVKSVDLDGGDDTDTISSQSITDEYATATVDVPADSDSDVHFRKNVKRGEVKVYNRDAMYVCIIFPVVYDVSKMETSVNNGIATINVPKEDMDDV